MCHLSPNSLLEQVVKETQGRTGFIWKMFIENGKQNVFGSVSMLSFMRFSDREISRDEFIFYSKRLMRLLIEFALSMLPFKVSCWKSTDLLKVFH